MFQLCSYFFLPLLQACQSYFFFLQVSWNYFSLLLFFNFCKFVKATCLFCFCSIPTSASSSTFDLITPWRLYSYQMGSSTSFYFLLTSLVSSRLVPQVKVVMLLFVVHLNALHLKLMLVQRMLQQNVVMCLTLTPSKKGWKNGKLTKIFRMFGQQSLHGRKMWLEQMGKWTWSSVVFAYRLKVETNFWFPNLIASKSMLGSI